MNHSLVTPTLILHSIIISFVAAWLARDTALASSVYSLQEMTNRVKDNRHPLRRLSGTQNRLYGFLSSTCLGNLSLFVSSSFPSDPPGWLVCCCATSAHSLQEMTDADEGRKTPFDALMVVV